MGRSRRYLFAVLATAIFVAPAIPAHSQPVLSDSLYSLHHPQLMFELTDLPALRSKIDDGGRDAEAYAYILDRVQNVYPVISTDSILGLWYGLEAIPNIGLVAYLEASPDTVAMALGKALTTYIADNFAPDFSVGHSGMRLRSLALGYDMFFADATESERAYIRAEIVSYIQKMIWNPAYHVYQYRPYLANKSAMFGAALGLAAIALHEEMEAYLHDDALAMADRIVTNLVNMQFDRGGAYNEGALYGLWTMRNLIYYFEARKRFDAAPIGDYEQLRAMEEWLAFELLPEGGSRSHNLNDSPYATTPFASNATYFDWATYKWNSGLSAWLWERTAGDGGVDDETIADKAATVLWHQTVPETPPDAILPSHEIWLSRGLYHLRTGWQLQPSSPDVLFSFYSGKFQGGHAQEDQNQFSLYAYGEKFAVDHGPGVVAKQSESHNMVLIDGNGQHNAGSSIGTDGAIVEYLLGGCADYIVGDATLAYSTYSEFNAPDQPIPGTDWSWGYQGANPVLFAHRRVLAVHGGAAPPYFVIMDDIDKDGILHEYEWRMHTLATNAVAMPGSLITISGTTGTMNLHLLNPEPDSVAISTLPHDNGNDDPDATVICVKRTASNPKFSFLMIPLANGTPPPALTEQRYAWGYACSVDWGGGIIDHLIRNDSGGLVTHGLIQTDAMVTFIRESAGVVASYMAAEVTSLTIDGTDWVTIFDGPVTCEMSGGTLNMDRLETDFQFWDAGLTHLFYREHELGFVVDNGYIVRGGSSTVGSVQAPPATLALEARPNPFNPSTLIRVTGNSNEIARVVVYDVTGRRIRVLWNALLGEQSRSLHWDGHDHSGSQVASGVYFVRATSGASSQTIKITVLK